MQDRAALDRIALDRIATILGTSPDWSSEYLEWIADIIGQTERPHPGDAAHTYTVDFHEATGRYCPAEYMGDDDDETIGAY